MATTYRQKLERDKDRARVKCATGRDVALDYPPPGDAARRLACACDLRRYAETYHKPAFPLPWSPDHLRGIATLARCILEGGLFAIAWPRGFGKTTLVIVAVLWALLYRHRRFAVLVAGTEGLAERLLKRIKTELLYNDLLYEDFRHVVHPIRRLQNNQRLAGGQLFRGERTAVEWGASRITFPLVPDDACDGAPNVSGSAVQVAALTGALRGHAITMPSGEVIRPDLAVADDPQTRGSASSVMQTHDRLETLRGDVVGLSGPGQAIACVVPCTIIQPDDLADVLTDRDRSPAWQGERVAAVTAWPSNESLWGRYHELRSDSLRAGRGGREATEFYRQHRAAMNAGSAVSWPERLDPGELSALQHCMNKRADMGENSFAAEYQNDPRRGEGDSLPTLTAAQIAARVNRVPRGVAPVQATLLTAGMDVQQNLLYWAVCAWAPGFSGWVLDYGTHPRQHASRFTARGASPTLQDVTPGAGVEGALLAGLHALADELCGRAWRREDGAEMKVERAAVDTGWLPDVVFEFCRRTPHAAVVLPARGLGIGASKTPMSEYTKKPGERHGEAWLIRAAQARAARHLLFDSNRWKSNLQARLSAALGDPGCISLYGSSAEAHRFLAEHLTAEAPRRVTSAGRTVDEWFVRPGHSENHWLDALTMAAVAASVNGIALGALPQPKPPERKKVSYRQQWLDARQRQGRR